MSKLSLEREHDISMKSIEELAEEVLEERYFGGADREAIENMIIEALRKQKDEIFGEQKQCRFGLSEECGNLCWQMPHHYLKIREQILQQKKQHDCDNGTRQMRGITATDVAHNNKGSTSANDGPSQNLSSPETEEVVREWIELNINGKRMAYRIRATVLEAIRADERAKIFERMNACEHCVDARERSFYCPHCLNEISNNGSKSGYQKALSDVLEVLTNSSLEAKELFSLQHSGFSVMTWYYQSIQIAIKALQGGKDDKTQQRMR